MKRYPARPVRQSLALAIDVTDANTQEYIVSIIADGNIRSQGAAISLEYSLPRGSLSKALWLTMYHSISRF